MDPVTQLRKSQEMPIVEVMDTSVDRVRWLLGERGITQGELASAIGLDASKMSKSLGGQRRFSSLEYALIAEETGVSVDWLLTGTTDHVAVAARAESRSNAAAAADQATQVVELARTAESLGRSAHQVTLVVDLDTGTWREQGERLADAALAVPGATEIAASTELAADIDRVFGIDVGVLDLGDDVDGLCALEGTVAVILAAPTPVPVRQRFTLAHELGHALARDDQGLRIDVDIENPGRDGSEQRANAFAAAFLMPAGLLEERVGSTQPGRDLVAELAIDLGVSPSALAHRMERLGMIDGMTCVRLGDMTHKQAQQLTGRVAEWGARQARAMEERPPPRLAAALYAAYVEGRTTLRPYARLIGADVDELRASLEGGER